jgi:hypothetical protein
MALDVYILVSAVSFSLPLDEGKEYNVVLTPGITPNETPAKLGTLTL